MRLTDNRSDNKQGSAHAACRLRSSAAIAVAAIAMLASFTSTTAAKTPGMLNCYKKICYRVLTHAQTEKRIGIVKRELASYYDEPGRDRFNPRLETSSGEMYDRTHDGHVASPIYLNGTELFLWNPRTKRAAHVRVNNNGPFWKRRTIDCSRAVAKKLGFLQQGVAPLHVMVVRPPSRVESRYRRARRYAPVPGYLGQFENFHQAILNSPLARPVFFGPYLGKKIYKIKLLDGPKYKKNHKPEAKKKNKQPRVTVMYVRIARDPKKRPTPLESKETARLTHEADVSPRDQGSIQTARRTPHSSAAPQSIAHLPASKPTPHTTTRPLAIAALNTSKPAITTNAGSIVVAASYPRRTLKPSTPAPTRVAHTNNARQIAPPSDRWLQTASLGISSASPAKPIHTSLKASIKTQPSSILRIASINQDPAVASTQAKRLSLLEYHMFHHKRDVRALAHGNFKLIRVASFDPCMSLIPSPRQCRARRHPVSSPNDPLTGHSWTWPVNEEAAIADAVRDLPTLFAITSSIIAEPKTAEGADLLDVAVQQLPASTTSEIPLKTGSLPDQLTAAPPPLARQPSATTKPKRRARKKSRARTRKRPKPVHCAYSLYPLQCMLQLGG